MRRFRKIHWDEKKVAIDWETSDGSEHGTVSHSLTSEDPPLPEFEPALQALAEPCRDLLCLPLPYFEGVKVRGVALSYDSEKRMGAVVTLLKTVPGANGPFVIHTPLVRAGDKPGEGQMSEALFNALQSIYTQADRYVEGKRAQQDLWESDGGEPGGEEDEEEPDVFSDEEALTQAAEEAEV